MRGECQPGTDHRTKVSALCSAEHVQRRRQVRSRTIHSDGTAKVHEYSSHVKGSASARRHSVLRSNERGIRASSRVYSWQSSNLARMIDVRLRTLRRCRRHGCSESTAREDNARPKVRAGDEHHDSQRITAATSRFDKSLYRVVVMNS